MSQCNDCLGSVQLQQGPAGPTGSTGPQGPPGNDGAASTVAGPQGPAGPTGPEAGVLIASNTLSSSITASSYTSALSSGPWTVPANTLKENGDTVRLEALAMTTIDDASLAGMQVKVNSVDVEIGLATGLFDFPNIERRGDHMYKLRLDLVKTSDILLGVESSLFIASTYIYSDYTLERCIPNPDKDPSRLEIHRTSQNISVSDLTTNSFTVDTLLRTDNPARPIKLLYAKLEKVKST